MKHQDQSDLTSRKQSGKRAVFRRLTASCLRYWKAFFLLAFVLLCSTVTYSIWSHSSIVEPDPLLPVLPEPVWRDERQTEAYLPTDGLTLTKVWDQVNQVPVLRDDLRILSQSGNHPNLPLLGMTVFLDAGHGGYDPGTIWPAQNDYEKAEKDLTLAIVKQLKETLEKMGANVILTREDDRFVSIFARTAFVADFLLQDYLKLAEQNPNKIQQEQNQNVLAALQKTLPLLQEVRAENSDKEPGLFGGIGASREARLLYDLQKQYRDCIFLSIHVNAAQRQEVGGAQVYLLRNGFIHRSQNIQPNAKEYRQGQTYLEQTEPVDTDAARISLYPLYVNYSDRERETLALSLYHSLDEQVPRLRTRETRSVLDQNFAVLRTCNLPSVLFETGFITNEEDRSFLWSEPGQQALVQSIAVGLINYKKSMLKQY